MMTWSQRQLAEGTQIDLNDDGSITQIANQAFMLEKMNDAEWFLAVGDRSFSVYAERHRKGCRLVVKENRP